MPAKKNPTPKKGSASSEEDSTVMEMFNLFQQERDKADNEAKEERKRFEKKMEEQAKERKEDLKEAERIRKEDLKDEREAADKRMLDAIAKLTATPGTNNQQPQQTPRAPPGGKTISKHTGQTRIC